MEADSRSPYISDGLRPKGTKQKIIRLVKKSIILIASFVLLFFLLNLIFPLRINIEYSKTIADVNGEVVNSFLTKDDKWRMYTELNEISPLLKKTILAKEDKYFYSHPGINPFAIGRAALKNMIHFRRTSGASTITMQVARALEHRKRTFGSKFIEMFRALQLEMKYSKDEILQLYLNLVPYGGNIEGVKAASLLYFSKNPDHLSLAQIVSLSIIPNRPSSLVIGKSNEKIILERNKWLQRFREENIFTKAEIEDALSEPLDAKRNTVAHLIPHLSYKLQSTTADLNIKTTIQPSVQNKIEKITEDYIRRLRLNKIRNAAVIVVNNETHEIVSYVGSADFKDTTDAGQVNGAAAIRQPGSTLKPLLYALSFDAGLLTPKTIINDVPVHYAGYNPENYDKKFNGYVSVEYALEHSLNIPAVKILDKLGKEKLISTLISANFNQIKKDQQKLGLSLILGGCGATLEELTGLFSAFANNGVYVQPSCIKKDQSKGREIISPSAAFLITEILSKVNRPDFPLAWSATEHMPKIAWKTGTSYGRKDAWSIGYNKKYTVGVWVGNFSGTGVPELSGANTATPLLFKIFNTIDYDSDEEWFSAPQELGVRMVCSESGLPPGSFCTNLVLDHFIPAISSTNICDHLEEYKISSDGKYSYCESCAGATGYIKKLYRKTVPEMQDYFMEQHTNFDKIPPHFYGCEKLSRGDGPRISSPTNNDEYFINKKDPQPLELLAFAGSDVTDLYWYINDQFYKKTKAGEKQFFIPEEGQIKISCTDDKGRNRNIKIVVKYVDL